MITEPSACWWVSSSAAMVRGRATPEALSVCTNSGFAPGAARQRMLARRAWKSVKVLELDTSSHCATPGAARLAAKAGGIGGVGEGQRRAVQDLVAVQIRHRHFGGGDEEEIVRGGLVGVLFEFRELPGADHAVAAHQEWRLHFDIPMLARVQIEHEVDEGARQLGPDAHEDGEARARELRAARQIQHSQRLTDFPVRLAAARGGVPPGADDPTVRSGAVGYVPPSDVPA